MIQINRLFAIIRTHAHEVMLVTDHVNQLELLEEGSERIETLSHFRPRLNGDAQRLGVIEDEAQERVPNWPFAPIRDEKIKAGQVRQLQVAFLIVRRKITQAAIFEISYAGNMHAVAINGRPRHDRDFRAPGPIVGW